MSIMTNCASDCTIRGQHITTCETRDAAENPCRGCLPRPAEEGLLCRWCWQRLRADIAATPELVHHLRQIGKPHAEAAPPSDEKAYTDPAEGSILPAAWLAADEIHAAVASWVLLFLEEHPNGPQMEGPDQAGAWLTRYGTVAGVRDAKATLRMAQWFLPHLAWCAAQEWSAVMRRELGSLVATATARWPTVASVEPTRSVAMPCPRCDLLSLSYTPPSQEAQPFKVACANPDCARIWSEDEWEWFVNVVVKSQRRAS